MADSHVSLVPATAFSPARLATLLNQAYADYYLPIWLDEPRILRMYREADVALPYSVVAVIDQEPVGLALFSLRGEQGWISGVGVLPSFRRQGVARRMLGYLQDQARRLGLRRVLLEVLIQNEAGLALYQSMGFKLGRDLIALILNPDTLEVSRLPGGILREDLDLLLSHYTLFHDVDPSWQRAYESLLTRRPTLKGIGFREDQQLVGYLLYQEQLHYQTIQDLAVLPTHPQRLDVGRRLLLAVHTLRPESGGCVINLPSDDPFFSLFLDLHYRIWQKQNEMVWIPDVR